VKDFVRGHRWLSAVGAVVLVLAVAVLGMGIYVAALAGDLPWQAEPTRIPITPFAGIENFSIPTQIPNQTTATPTP
jgi:hypothetical protein